jgi:hypothetical protein
LGALFFGQPMICVALDANGQSEMRIRLIHVRGESRLIAHMSPASAASSAASSCSLGQSPASSRPPRLGSEGAFHLISAVLPHPPPRERVQPE